MASPMVTRRPSARLRQIHLLLGGLASFAMAATSVHCAADGDTSDGSGGGNGSGNPSGSGAGIASGTGGELGIDAPGGMDHSIDRFFEDDPPPMSCDGGGMAPPAPGGTPECPDDKNLPGCPCTQQGETAACWTGKRKNRHHGVCKDGETTCVLNGENDLTWGDCVGEVLPDPNATSGKAACLCFSGGHWDIDNTSPCFFFNDPSQTNVAATVSTTLNGTTIQCPADINGPPAEPWSKNRLTVDCTGYFKLCYSIKAGDGANPQPTDCEIVKVCTEAYYTPANTVVEFPVLPSWLANDPATITCANSFVANGGYGEMSVVGESDECDHVDKVFQHVTYCPLACNGPNPPAMCANCQPGGGGNF